MQYEFSSLLPRKDQIPEGSDLTTIDNLIAKHNKEIDDAYNNKNYLPFSEITKLEKRVTELQVKKQAAETKLLVHLERLDYWGHFAKLDPTVSN